MNAREASRAATPVKPWDSIVSNTLIADVADFEFDVRQEADEQVYTFIAIDEAASSSYQSL